METLIAYLDTHVILAMRREQPRWIGPRARRAIERSEELRISPAVLLELQMLREIGRITVGPEAFLEGLHETFPVLICDLPFEDVVEASKKLAWTRDPIDRLIVAQAAVGRASLLTKDEKIRKHCSFAVWD